MGEEEVNINVRCSNGSKLSVRVGLSATVADFKAVLSQSTDIPSEQQRLIYKGRILKDDQTLLSYGLQADHTVHMVRGFAPATSNPPPTSINANITNPTPTPIENIGLGPSLFPNLDLNSLNANVPTGLFGTGPPNFEQMQQQLTQNPNMMRDLMNTPAIQNLMNNPELVQSMIMNNPQMRQIINQNPELGHVINDPSILRQTLEAARNPELMREMMRNTDRAMSNIESSPEGFNALRRMYENVEEPFLNASETMGHENAINPLAALLGGGGSQTRDELNSVSETNTGSTMPNSNPLPNPWGGGPQANSTTRPNTPARAAIRPQPGIAGLGGFGLPELDPSTMGQLLQNPAVSQMMQSMFSNPEYINQFIGSNPQVQAMLDTNPQFREMMQNPEFLQQLTSPGTMQQVMAIQQSLTQLNRQQSTQDGVQSDGTQGTQNNSGLDMLMNMFSGLGAGGINVPNSQSNVPPEELYATQLSQLQEMGFFDSQENIRALRATSGNVHAAVERLLGNLGQ